MSDTQRKEVRLFDVEEGTILLSKPGATVKVVQAGKLDGKSVSQKAKVKILTSEVQVEIEDPDAILFAWDPEKATDLQGLFKAYEDAATPDRKAELEWVLEYAETEEGEEEVLAEVAEVAEEADSENAEAEESVEQEETAAVANEKAPVKEAPAKKGKPAPKPKKEKSSGPTMADIINPMLEAKKHTAEEIAEKVKEAFPEKYADEKAFKTLVNQIKGPRLYNAKKAGKDVALVSAA